MTRRCSNCSNNGHNSRTCPSSRSGGVRLFGVQLTEGSGAMKKSASMSCLYSASISSAVVSGASINVGDAVGETGDGVAAGYASDEPYHASCSSNCRSERKKGVPWTEEEHRMFLLGLKKLGKGDWRGIARNYVISRTPTQVASHAQKYFIRQSNSTRRKRRSSLFDIVTEMPPDQVAVHEEHCHPQSPPSGLEKTSPLPALHLGQQQRPELVDPSVTNHISELGERILYSNAQIAMVSTLYPAFVPVPLPFWSSSTTRTEKEIAREEKMTDAHGILKPTPIVLREEPVNMEEVAIISKLSISEQADSLAEPSALTLELQGASSSRQSAFHIDSSSITCPDLNQSSSSRIRAV